MKRAFTVRTPKTVTERMPVPLRVISISWAGVRQWE